MSHTTSLEPDEQTQPDRVRFRRLWLAALLLLLIIGGALYATGSCPQAALCGPVVATDVSQGRIDTALPFPNPDLTIEQSFVPEHNGLSAIELILVRSNAGSAGGRLTIELLDDRDAVVSSHVLGSQEFAHNQAYTLDFPAQQDSAGRTYRLRLSGNGENQLTTWGYSLDVLEPGELSVTPRASTAAQEMRFVTTYELTTAGALASLAATLAGHAGLILLTIAFLLLPGSLLLVLWPHRWDAAAWVGAALALGVAIWPLAWLWLTVVGGAWSGRLLWAVFLVGWAAVLGLWIGRLRRAQTPPRAVVVALSAADWWTYGLLAAILITSVAVRLLAVRDLAFPPWVDSSRHGLITAVMAAQGQSLTNYRPFLPVDVAPYHYGFHAISASLDLMTGTPLETLLLVLGQLLNGLIPLTVYAAGWMVSRQKSVGLLAAFLVALPFYFPGYYVTWGRMTQLAAMLILPVLLGLTWRVGLGWRKAWPLVAILGAGTFLIHVRVFLFFIPFALLMLLVQVLTFRRFRPYLLAAGAGLLLVLPRVVQLWRDANPLQSVQNSIAGFNDFPTGYFTAGWERAFFFLAAVGLLVVVVALWRGERWAFFPFVLVIWVGSLFFLLAGERLGLPETLVVNLNSMVISLFLPLSLFLALVAVRVWHWGGRLVRSRGGGRTVEPVAAVALGALVAALTLFGIRTQIGIVNPQTILALPQDVAALTWIDDNLGEDAVIAVSSWQWLGNTWAAADGGAWIVPLTGREATTPPIDHIYNRELFAQVRAFNDHATAVTDWSAPTAAEWLRAQGVTHVYVGEKGGFLDPAALSRNPLLTLIFHSGGTFVFEVNGP